MNLMPALRDVVKLDAVRPGLPPDPPGPAPHPPLAPHTEPAGRWQIAKEPEETIREIWDLRHRDDPERVGAVLSVSDFNDMRARVARRWPPPSPPAPAAQPLKTARPPQPHRGV